MKIFCAGLASFGHLGLISSPLMVSRFHNVIRDTKGKENQIYTIVKASQTFYRHHTDLFYIFYTMLIGLRLFGELSDRKQ